MRLIGYLREIEKLRARQNEATEDGHHAEAESLEEEITAIENAFRQKNLTTDAGEKARNNVSKALTALRRKLSKGEPPRQSPGGPPRRTPQPRLRPDLQPAAGEGLAIVIHLTRSLKTKFWC